MKLLLIPLLLVAGLVLIILLAPALGWTRENDESGHDPD